VQPEPPAALPVFEALREEWRGRVELQFVSLTPLDLFADLAAGERIACEVKRAGGVLGAFVYRNEGIVHKLGRVFDLAQQHGLGLDFHVDEGLDAEASGLRSIAQLVRARNFRNGVACGHACSLSVQGDGVANETLALCAGAGIHLVALPTTNLYLQGAWDRTPVQRGITRIREAAAWGLRASLATDNVQDAFYPYGSYDLLETFGLGVQMAHLAPASDWLDAVTVSPAKALGLAWDGRIAPGCPADLLVLAATDEHELIGPRGRQRTVIRAGRALEKTQ
jgi:cytosine deaminase